MSKRWIVAAAVTLMAEAPAWLSGQESRAPGETAQLVRWAIGLASGQEEPEPAAIHADAAVIRGSPHGGKAELKSTTSSTEVWVLPLNAGDCAVAAFNQGERAAQVDVVWKELGIDGQPSVRDVLNRKDMGKVHGGFAVKLRGGEAALYRVMIASKSK